MVKFDGANCGWRNLCALVAQWIEHQLAVLGVGGSSPPKRARNYLFVYGSVKGLFVSSAEKPGSGNSS